MSLRGAPFRAGDSVLYVRSTADEPKLASVLRVHDDDMQHGYYFTVRLEDGREVQTTPTRLRPGPRPPSARPPAAPSWARVLDEATGCYYWYEEATGRTEWDTPEARVRLGLETQTSSARSSASPPKGAPAAAPGAPSRLADGSAVATPPSHRRSAALSGAPPATLPARSALAGGAASGGALADPAFNPASSEPALASHPDARFVDPLRLASSAAAPARGAQPQLAGAEARPGSATFLRGAAPSASAVAPSGPPAQSLPAAAKPDARRSNPFPDRTAFAAQQTYASADRLRDMQGGAQSRYFGNAAQAADAELGAPPRYGGRLPLRDEFGSEGLPGAGASSEAYYYYERDGDPDHAPPPPPPPPYAPPPQLPLYSDRERYRSPPTQSAPAVPAQPSPPPASTAYSPATSNGRPRALPGLAAPGLPPGASSKATTAMQLHARPVIPAGNASGAYNPAPTPPSPEEDLAVRFAASRAVHGSRELKVALLDGTPSDLRLKAAMLGLALAPEEEHDMKAVLERVVAALAELAASTLPRSEVAASIRAVVGERYAPLAASLAVGAAASPGSGASPLPAESATPMRVSPSPSPSPLPPQPLFGGGSVRSPEVGGGGLTQKQRSFASPKRVAFGEMEEWKPPTRAPPEGPSADPPAPRVLRRTASGGSGPPGAAAPSPPLPYLDADRAERRPLSMGAAPPPREAREAWEQRPPSPSPVARSRVVYSEDLRDPATAAALGLAAKAEPRPPPVVEPVASSRAYGVPDLERQVSSFRRGEEDAPDGDELVLEDGDDDEGGARGYQGRRGHDEDDGDGDDDGGWTPLGPIGRPGGGAPPSPSRAPASPSRAPPSPSRMAAEESDSSIIAERSDVHSSFSERRTSPTAAADRAPGRSRDFSAGGGAGVGAGAERDGQSREDGDEGDEAASTGAGAEEPSSMHEAVGSLADLNERLSMLLANAKSAGDSIDAKYGIERPPKPPAVAAPELGAADGGLDASGEADAADAHRRGRRGGPSAGGVPAVTTGAGCGASRMCVVS